MDEESLLHQISIEVNVNIELLKDLYHNDKLMALIQSGKNTNAILLIRSIQPRVELGDAKLIVEKLSSGLK